ncbi:glucosaminidase domain-containing protein [Enterococcus casseliflavus]|uniref:M23 family metallopeptidase n=1 Tax=Enterococcus casseliflavus TaxID=37734 RepID=UPI003DA415AA
MAFIREVGDETRKIGLEKDLYASVMIAQAILESGSGQSLLSQAPYYNLFGIKGSYEGNSVTFKTQEDVGHGNLSDYEAAFRQYGNITDSLKDYAELLKEGIGGNQFFYKGAWKSETITYKEATNYLTGRYATDRNYDEKLNALIEAYQLTSYDNEAVGFSTTEKNMIYPITEPVISSTFGLRGNEFHRRVDFAASFGSAIQASLSGTIIRSEYLSSWGNYVAFVHENGMTTLYAHNSQNLVEVGQSVSQGEVIALVGSTGNSTGPHLHFGVNYSQNLSEENLVDPLSVLTK